MTRSTVLPATAALRFCVWMGVEMMKEMHGWKEKSEVMVPSITYIATSNAVISGTMRERLPILLACLTTAAVEAVIVLREGTHGSTASTEMRTCGCAGNPTMRHSREPIGRISVR